MAGWVGSADRAFPNLRFSATTFGLDDRPAGRRRCIQRFGTAFGDVCCADGFALPSSGRVADSCEIQHDAPLDSYDAHDSAPADEDAQVADALSILIRY